MKFALSLAVLSLMVGALALSLMAAAAAGLLTAVTYVPHDKVTATMTKGGAIIEDKGGLRVLAQRRGTGEVEVHMKTNHVFIIVEGEATLITGGTLVGSKQTAPDEVRAASVQGGQTHHLTKGDVITIPANTPHWFKEIPSGTIAYYAVNIQN